MKKNTELYTLSIPVEDGVNTRKGLQKACESVGLFPFKFSKSSNGVCMKVLRNPSCASYKMSDDMMTLSARIKKELTITSITMVKKCVTVDTDRLPVGLTDFGVAEAVEASEEDASMLKKIEEDSSAFDTHTTQQFLSVDYDHRENREAELRAIKLKRAAKRMPVREETEEEIASKKGKRQKTIKGQLCFDLTRM